ncbi:MAG: GAP family protein [Bacteriovoracaceae bacterium]|jgi:hypothetical protein|nr:GAP family protein [Bacteriovoracaceae bacterium]
MKFAVLFALIFSVNAFSVCMTEDDALLYECLPMHEADAWCSKKHGQEYKAYRTTNTCNKELSYSLRGQIYTPTKHDFTGKVEAACMTYEQGQNLGCEYYDYVLAQNYCAENFGMKFLAFVPSDVCTLKKASKLRGEVSPKKLLTGLSSQIDELEVLVGMIDKEKAGQEAQSYYSNNDIAISHEFYTSTMKKIMAYMYETKELLHKNSQYNVKVEKNKYVVKFLRMSLRYMNLLSRIYKIYAVAAHKNTYVLKTYKFENLEYLNLKLKKVFALELLSMINFKTKHTNNDKDIEFLVSEQEKQNYEYFAVSKPDSKIDYAKLVTYMGSKEMLTNTWGVQRLTQKNISKDKIKWCGKGFLSLRSSGGSLANSKAMKDLWEGDIFYTDYHKRIDKVVLASWEVPVLTKQNSYNFIRKVLTYNVSIKEQIESSLEFNEKVEDVIKQRAKENYSIYQDGENTTWATFSNYHFGTISLMGDGVLSKDTMINRFVKAAYDKRVKALSETFIAMYPYMADRKFKVLENYINKYAADNLKNDFEKRLKAAIVPFFEGYNSMAKRDENRKAKEKETLDALKKGVTGIALQLELQKDSKGQIDDMKWIQPHNMQELMMVFEDGLVNSKSVRATLKHDKKKAKLVQKFFEDIATKFHKKFSRKDKFGNVTLTGTRSDREKGLRQIAFDVAKDYYNKYPYTLKFSKFNMSEYISSEEFQQKYGTVKVDNTYVYVPVFKDGSVIPMQNSDLEQTIDFSNFNFEKYNQDLSEQKIYIAKADNTRNENAYLNPLLIGTPYGVKVNPEDIVDPQGYNKDKVSMGIIKQPVVITQKDKEELRASIERKKNEKMINLAKNNPAFKDLKGWDNLSNSIGLGQVDEELKDFVAKSEGELFYNIFFLLNLNKVSYVEEDKDFGFIQNKELLAQFAAIYSSQAYELAPILKTDVKWTTRVKRYRNMGYGEKYGHYEVYYVDKTVEGELAKRVVDVAYNKKTGVLDESIALSYIKQGYNRAIDNAQGKLETFCNADYVNYEDDEKFKTAFKSSKYLRENLMSAQGTSVEMAERIKQFDEDIRKEIRSTWEKLEEDWLQPIMLYSGIVAVICLAIIVSIGTAGTGAPAAIAGVASFIMAVDTVMYIPLIAVSIYARVQTNFIEMPAQLRFNQSLALSQISETGIIEWNHHREAKKQAKKTQLYSIGFMALDVVFVFPMLKQTKQLIGVAARNSFKKLTKVRLRGWSAPSANMYRHTTFREFRKKHNFFRSIQKSVGQNIEKIRYYQPKYQDIPLSQIRTTALRQGLKGTAQKAKVFTKPWALKDEIAQYAKELNEKAVVFRKYLEDEARTIVGVTSKTFSPKDVYKFGMKYSKAGIFFQSATEAIGNKNFYEYISTFGSQMKKLNKLRGELISEKVADLDVLISKLDEMKQLAANNKRADFDIFMSKMTDEELMILSDVARRSKKGSLMRNFKKTFKLIKEVNEGFANTKYMNGAYAGRVMSSSVYPNSLLMENDLPQAYKFSSDSEDIVNFYESMMHQHRFSESEKVLELKKEVEEGLEKLFFFDENGNKVFL